MLRRSWMLLPGLLLMATACARSSADPPQPVDNPVWVEVTNRHALPIEIDALGSGMSRRLGVVEPGMAGHFVVPPSLIAAGGGVELQAHPSASKQLFSSGPLLLSPGAVVDLEITPQLFNSTATVRPQS